MNDDLKNLRMDSPRLLNLTQLKTALGVSYAFVSQMKKWGCPFPGGKITIGDAHQWLKNNPDFTPYGKPKEKTGPYGLPISAFTPEELKEYSLQNRA